VVIEGSVTLPRVETSVVESFEGLASPSFLLASLASRAFAAVVVDEAVVDERIELVALR